MMFKFRCGINGIKVVAEKTEQEGRKWFKCERNGKLFVVSKSGSASWGWMAGEYSHGEYGHTNTVICFNVSKVISYITGRS